MNQTIPNGGVSDLGKLSKEMKDVVRIAREAKWTVWKTRKGHLRFRPPAGSTRPRDGQTGDHEDHRSGGRTLTHGTTDSDVNGVNLFRADLRREGLEGV
jgi:hypothetical protein